MLEVVILAVVIALLLGNNWLYPTWLERGSDFSNLHEGLHGGTKGLSQAWCYSLVWVECLN